MPRGPCALLISHLPVAGMSEPPSSSIIPPETSLEDGEDPEEIKEFIQELTSETQTMTPGHPVRPAPLLIQLLGIMACGAVSTAGKSAVSAASAVDNLVIGGPLGKRWD